MQPVAIWDWPRASDTSYRKVATTRQRDNRLSLTAWRLPGYTAFPAYDQFDNAISWPFPRFSCCLCVVWKDENTAVGIRHSDHMAPLYLQKLALTSPTSGGRSVGIVRSRTQNTEFSFVCVCVCGRRPVQSKASVFQNSFVDIWWLPEWGVSPLRGF
jgi:hypothetical protein